MREFILFTRKKVFNTRFLDGSTLILSMRNNGAKWSKIVQALNVNGFKTRRNCSFDRTVTKRMYFRYAEKNL